jgi:ribonuclease E
MNTLRIDRRWPRRERARIDPRWVVILGAMLALFVASFAIGHATKSASAPHVEASSSLSATPAVASVPVRLSTAPALGIGAPVVARPVHHKKAQPAAQAVSSPAQPLSGETPRQQAPVAQPVVSAPAPAPRPAPAPVATPAPKPAPVHTSAPAAHPKPSSSGGGSFESSG